MATYTDEQIKQVCDAAASVLAGHTDAQNVTFPSTPIIEGMKAGLTAEEIASNARKAIDDLPLLNNGTYNLIGSNINMFNLGQYLYGAVLDEINKLGSSTEEPKEP